MEVSNEILWLTAGVIMVVAEFTIAPGIGLLFAGAAALLVGGSLGLGADITMAEQAIAFFALTILITTLLYKPFKNFRSSKTKQYQDVVGSIAVLETALTPGETGKARWSGTIMKAKLCQSCATAINSGEEVRIVAVEGNILIVKK